MTHPVVNVAELIDSRPVGRAQVGIVILCGLIALLDGLDLQAIGLAAPAITAALKVPPQAFGAVFSAALAGLALGAFGLGPVADRIGRKRVLVGSTLCFGMFTLCTAFAGSLNELLLYRFLTGIGLGGAMPSFISLTSEYAPRKHRATIVSLLWAGFPLGGVIGGLLALQLLPAYGWQSLFWVGGILPMLLTVLLLLALPESIGFLVSSGAPRDRVVHALARVCPGVVIASNARLTLGEERTDGASIRKLFSPGRAAGTTLLWASFFFTFMILVTNTAWAPTLLRDEGIAVAQSAVAMATFNLGSVVGTSLAGYLVTRFGAAAVLPAAFVGATAALALVGQSAPAIPLVVLLQGFLGLCLGTGSSGLIALGALFYPTAIRSTGLGWAMGMGRFGSFVGPLAVGLFVGWQWPVATIFLVIGLPALLVAATAGLVGRQRAMRTSGPQLTPVPLIH